MTANLQFQDLYIFFQGDIPPKYFRLRRAKISGGQLGGPSPPPACQPRKKIALPKPAEKLRFQVRQKNVDIWQVFGKNKLKIKNEKKKLKSGSPSGGGG